MNDRPDAKCKSCGGPITTPHGIARALRRGYGFCGQPCEAAHKAEQAADNLAMRFMRRVVFKSDDECWPFRGNKLHGYPVIDCKLPNERRGRPHPAHRMMWSITMGPIPPGSEVCHACDNPGCCNPGHLWLGTHADNMADMARKGRSVKGRKFPGRRSTNA